MAQTTAIVIDWRNQIPTAQKRKIEHELTKDLLDIIILKELTVSPAHGYEIIKRIRTSMHTFFGPSTMYPRLAEMEEDGFVRSAWDMTADRPRKTYSITTKGSIALEFALRTVKIILGGN